MVRDENMPPGDVYATAVSGQITTDECRHTAFIAHYRREARQD